MCPAIRGTRSRNPVVDVDCAQLAAAVRRESGAVAQVRDIDAGSKGRIHDGLPLSERDFMPVYIYGIGNDRIGIFAHIIHPLFQMRRCIVAMCDLARFFQRRVQIEVGLEIAVRQMLFEDMRKTMHNIQDVIRCSLPEPAMRPAFD